MRQARALAASSGGQEVALATTADGLVEGPTTDLALIETAIDRLAPSGGEGTAWPRVVGTEAVHFFTDGGVQTAVADDVILHSVYEPAPNVAITAFAARAATSGVSSAQAYLEIVNYADTPQDVRVSLARGSVTLVDQPVPIGAGEVVRQFVPLQSPGSARLLARVSAPKNALAIDDEAVAWMAGSEVLDVTVVTDAAGVGPLAELLQRDPGVKVTFVTTANYRPGREDVTIFDRTAPAAAPTRPALVIAPPASAWFGPPASEEKAARWVAESAHPVLAGVDPLTVEVRRAHAYSAPGLTCNRVVGTRRAARVGDRRAGPPRGRAGVCDRRFEPGVGAGVPGPGRKCARVARAAVRTACSAGRVPWNCRAARRPSSGRTDSRSRSRAWATASWSG